MNFGAMAAEMAKKVDRTDFEKKIAARPKPTDLVEKNIMKQGEPAIQGARDALKKAQTKDALADKLAQRPPPSELQSKLDRKPSSQNMK